MTANLSRKWTGTCLGIIGGLIGILLWTGEVPAAEKVQKEPLNKAQAVKPETAPPKAVTSAPACDFNLHPKIANITPDHINPGTKITIKGTSFGKRECFKDVSFGSTHIKNFKYVNDTTVEATVPAGLKPGMMQVHIQTAGGTAQDTVLVGAK